MRVNTQLQLLQALNRRRSTTVAGFTLIELIIVVAIVGTLAAMVLPQFNNAKTRAGAGAGVGQAIGLAKECATGMASGLAQTVSGNTCDGSGDVTFTATWSGGAAPGVRCLNKTAGSETQLIITVSSNGSMTCA